MLAMGTNPVFAQDWVGTIMPANSNNSSPELSPKIKKEVFKDFQKVGDELVLKHQSVGEYNINGKLVQFAEYHSNKNGELQLSSIKIVKYDRNGTKLGTLLYNDKNALIWSEEFVLDDLGRKKKVEQTNLEGDAPLKKIITFQYDSRGKISSSATYNSANDLIAEYKRSYNALGETTAISSWSMEYSEEEQKNIRHSSVTNYQYDHLGKLLRSETEIQEGKNKVKDIRSFENGFMVEWWQFVNGIMTSHYKHNRRSGNIPETELDQELPPPIPYQTAPFEYDDDKRNPLQNISHTPLRTVTIKTDAYGNVVKEVVREQQQVVGVVYFFYDEEHRLIREKKIDKLEDWVDETIYEYDSFGNILRQTTYRAEEIIKERSFHYEYYNQ